MNVASFNVPLTGTCTDALRQLQRHGIVSWSGEEETTTQVRQCVV